VWEIALVALQGGFAKCYELTDTVSKQVFAGKIVPKSLLVKPHQREKVFSLKIFKPLFF